MPEVPSGRSSTDALVILTAGQNDTSLPTTLLHPQPPPRTLERTTAANGFLLGDAT
jgi:hypothetical protein